MNQAACALLMVEPTTFGYNRETADSNFFQKQIPDLSGNEINQRALNEFYNAVTILKKEGIKVLIKQNPPMIKLPDAVFPNNWVSFMQDGTVIIYPMMATNRRMEKDTAIMNQIAQNSAYQVNRIIDLSHFENEGKYLEGTGSIVFDHLQKTAFACLSPRTDKDVLNFLCKEINYKPFTFGAYDNQSKEVYHTNVVMTITSRCAVVCLLSIKNASEKFDLTGHFDKSGRLVIGISLDQMEAFAGNMLEIENNNNKTCLVMSQTAYDSLDRSQLKSLENLHQLVVLPIPTIEKTGGGSARCMLAEIFA